MAKKVNNSADVKKLKDMLIQGWRKVQAKHPGEKLYAFGIHTDECAASVAPLALGEQGLKKVAGEYTKKGHLPSGTAENELRWSADDSPHQKYLDSLYYDFPDRKSPYDLSQAASNREVSYRLNAACAALKELDKQGLFGKGDQREQITLLIDGGDVDGSWLLKWARKLNPRSVYDRYAQLGNDPAIGQYEEIGSTKVDSVQSMFLARDQNVLLTTGDGYLFRFDMDSPKQKYSKSYRNRGCQKNLLQASMGHDLSQIVVLSRDIFQKPEIMLVDAASGSIHSSIEIPYSISSLVADPAGQWIAAIEHGESFRVLDFHGNCIKSLPVVKRAIWRLEASADCRFLAYCDIQKIVVIESGQWSVCAEIEGRYDGISMDDAGRFLVACRTCLSSGGGKGVATIIDLQTARPVQELSIEGQFISYARISPDARYLACAVHQRGESIPPTTAALLEISTGRVVDWLRFRKPIDQINDFLFLPNRRQIAVAVEGQGMRPLNLWTPCGMK